MSIENYVQQTHGRKNALVDPEYVDSVGPALMTGEGCKAATARGRTQLTRFPYPDGHGLIRSYRRGGLVRYILADTYPFANRPLRELEILCFLYEKDLAVPRPLGVCWERTPLGYRGSIATKEVDAIPLVEFLKNSGESIDEVLAQCGALIRSMHDIGLFHADLQVRNILIGPTRTYLIDFDNAKKKQSLAQYQRARNLLRLKRSIEKNRISPDVFIGICAGYGEIHIPGWLSRLYTLRGVFSERMSGAGGKGTR